MKETTDSPFSPMQSHLSKRKAAPPKVAGVPEASPNDLAQANLADEVRSLRLIMRLVEDRASKESSLTELLRMLDGLGKASTRLATLLKTQQALGKEDDFGSTFNQVLAEVIHEMEIKGPF